MKKSVRFLVSLSINIIGILYIEFLVRTGNYHVFRDSGGYVYGALWNILMCTLYYILMSESVIAKIINGFIGVFIGVFSIVVVRTERLLGVFEPIDLNVLSTLIFIILFIPINFIIERILNFHK